MVGLLDIYYGVYIDVVIVSMGVQTCTDGVFRFVND